MAASLRRRIGPYAHMKAPAEICGPCQAIIEECDGWVPYQESLLRFQLGWLLVFLLRRISGMEQLDRGRTNGEEENSAVELADMIDDIENSFADCKGLNRHKKGVQMQEGGGEGVSDDKKEVA